MHTNSEIESPASRVPAAAPTPSSGLWEAHLAPFFERYFLILCLGLVGIASARIISTYNALSLTADEPIHFACGLEYVAKHVYRLETQHPPLSRMMQALGPYFIGVRPIDIPGMKEQGLAAMAHSGQVDRVVFLMRLGNLPFFLLACLVVGLWGNKFGRPVAVLALALFTLLPTMLADAGLATTDMALGATVGAAFLALMSWAEKPTPVRSMLLGLCTALACLSKFTALGYLPAAGIFALVSYIAVRWPVWNGGNLPKAGVLGVAWHLASHWSGWREFPTLARQRLVPFALVLSTTALVIWACYWFSLGRGSLHGVEFTKLPAPEFFDGIRVALRHSREGHGAFLLGHFGWTGWWYYFPVALLLKTPIAFLILFALGALVCFKERAHAIYLMPLAFSLGILLPAMNSRVDIGVRHVEPIYIGLSIVAALGLRQLFQWARTGPASALVAGVLVLWMIVSVGVHHPDYLAYFNAFAGKRPERILVDSNSDWGQDQKLLAKRLRALGVHQFSLAWSDGVGLNHPEYEQAWYGLPPFKVVNACVPAPGWNVLSPTVEKSLSWWPDTEFYRGIYSPKTWYEQVTPTERVGPLLLYYIAPDTKLNCLPSDAIGVASAASLSGYAQPPNQPDSNKAEIKTTKISDNFYTLEGQGSAIGLLTGSDGIFMVADSAPMNPDVLAAVKQISNAPIRFLVSTHARGEGRVKYHLNGEDVDVVPISEAQIVYFRNSDVIMTGDFYGSLQYPNIDPASGGSFNAMLDGFDSVLEFLGPNTKIVPAHGPVIGRAEVAAHRDMLFAIRYRVAELVAQGKTQEQVLAAHPTSDYDAKIPNSKESTERFVNQVYADVIAQGTP